MRDLRAGPATAALSAAGASRGSLAGAEVALGEPVQVKLILEGRRNIPEAVTFRPSAGRPRSRFRPETTTDPTPARARRRDAGDRIAGWFPSRPGRFLPALERARTSIPRRQVRRDGVNRSSSEVEPGVVAPPWPEPQPPNLARPEPAHRGRFKSLRHPRASPAPTASLWQSPCSSPPSSRPVGLWLAFGLGGVRPVAPGSARTKESLKKQPPGQGSAQATGGADRLLAVVGLRRVLTARSRRP